MGTPWTNCKSTLLFTSIDCTLGKRVRRKRPELWENDSWILHRDDAPAHNALSVKRFLAKNRTPVLQRPLPPHIRQI